MAGDGDIKSHATSSEDFYGLLGISPGVNESEIRRAYRRTALKYHPDKVGADASALEKFHLLQIAHDVLSDQELRQLYDNTRRAHEEKQARVAALDGRRRRLAEDLERREREGTAKRKREAGEIDDFQREETRLAEDGRRRTREREAKLRREAQEEFERYEGEGRGSNIARPEKVPPRADTDGSKVPAQDRTVIVRFPKDSFDRDRIVSLFDRFGKVDEVVLQTKMKKKRNEADKHMREYTLALLEFNSVVGAHAAVTDWPDLAKSDTGQTSWGMIESVRWLGGKEPDCLPKQAMKAHDQDSGSYAPDPSSHRPSTEVKESEIKVEPCGGNFGDVPNAPKSTLDPHESLMVRLKNAERIRQARKLRQAVQS